ncbi:MAG TPA: DUF2924 domain-containing protein [Roseiarcus sp.]|nr:DUF2924 domain-containing protein [Roseiarcus sp.]
MAALSPRQGVESVERAIERLHALDGEALRIEWRNLFGRRAPNALPKSLIVRALAYRLQALESGDLDPHTLRVLDAYAAKSAGGLRSRVRLDRLRGTTQAYASSAPSIKPGSIQVREWAGELQRVMVLEVGFAWNGATYRSLSEVARAITGTRWNGSRFFGLSKGADAASASRASDLATDRDVGSRRRRRARLDVAADSRPGANIGCVEVSP